MELFTIPVLAAVSLLNGIKSLCGFSLCKGKEPEIKKMWRNTILYWHSGSWLLFNFLIWLIAGESMRAVRMADLCSTYGILAWIDGKKRIVPDSVLICFLIEQTLMGAMVMRLEILLKIFFTGIIFTVAAMAFSWISRGEIGLGDIRLLGVTAMVAGWGYVLQIIFWAMLISFFYSLFLIVFEKKTIKTEFPFVPFLAVGLAINIMLLRF